MCLDSIDILIHELAQFCTGSPKAGTSAPSTKKKQSGRRGSNRREAHSVMVRANVIFDYETEGLSQDVTAGKYNINRSLISKWLKDKKKIHDAAAVLSYKRSVNILIESVHDTFFKQNTLFLMKTDLQKNPDQLGRPLLQMSSHQMDLKRQSRFVNWNLQNTLYYRYTFSCVLRTMISPNILHNDYNNNDFLY